MVARVPTVIPSDVLSRSVLWIRLRHRLKLRLNLFINKHYYFSPLQQDSLSLSPNKLFLKKQGRFLVGLNGENNPRGRWAPPEHECVQVEDKSEPRLLFGAIFGICVTSFRKFWSRLHGYHAQPLRSTREWDFTYHRHQRRREVRFSCSFLHRNASARSFWA